MTSSELEPVTWLRSAYGRSYISAEKAHLDRALRQISGPSVLKIGDVIDEQMIIDLDFPQLITVHQQWSKQAMLTQHSSNQVVADPAWLPFDANSLSSVILPHVLESHSLPHQVLREVHRVLRSDGHLILTGFNPVSLLGLQRLIFPRAVCKGNYYSVRRVRDWLQLLGFELVASAMYQYAPLVRNARVRNALGFINSVGDRWLPMTGGGYMISAKKRDAGMRLVGKMRFSGVGRRGRKLVAASVKESVRAKSARSKENST